MSPQSATTNPAPALGTTPRTGRRKPAGPVQQRRVVARATGASSPCTRAACRSRARPSARGPSRPAAGSRRRRRRTAAWRSPRSGPRSGVPSGVSGANVFGVSHARRTASASSTAPVAALARTPRFTTTRLRAGLGRELPRAASISASVSVGKWLIDTTHGQAVRAARCRCARPGCRRRAAARRDPRSPAPSNGMPPWDFVRADRRDQDARRSARTRRRGTRCRRTSGSPGRSRTPPRSRRSPRASARRGPR